MVANQVRALNPKPGSATFVAGNRLKVWRGQVSGLASLAGKPGQVLKVQGDSGILVACGEGAVVIQEAVSYTHLDVYKRQHSNRNAVFARCVRSV